METGKELGNGAVLKVSMQMRLTIWQFKKRKRESVSRKEVATVYAMKSLSTPTYRYWAGRHGWVPNHRRQTKCARDEGKLHAYIIY